MFPKPSAKLLSLQGGVQRCLSRWKLPLHTTILTFLQSTP